MCVYESKTNMKDVITPNEDVLILWDKADEYFHESEGIDLIMTENAKYISGNMSCCGCILINDKYPL